MPLYLVTAITQKAYGLDVLVSPRYGIERALKVLLLTAALAIGVLFILQAGEAVSRLVLGLGVLLSAVAIGAFRWSVGQAIGRANRWRFTNDILIVDGAPTRPQAGELVVIADGADDFFNQDAVVMDRLGKALLHADRVVLAASPDRRGGWTRALKGIGIDVEVLAPELSGLGPVALRSYGSTPTLVVGLKPLGMTNRAKKRALDLAVTAPALLFLALPLLLIALAIRLESRGPALFRQPRVGEGNRIFSILKFRSMRVEGTDSAGVRSASREDDRVTRIGRLIRRTSIDELPQLLNVLKGDMSLVGPRPHALASKAEEALFWEVDNRYWERHGIKPGITGLAQIRGFRGATECRSDLINRVQADLEYLQGWSLRRDLMILIRTLRVITHPNAF
ncbi:sugar transferase [Sphingomonas sp. GCM10030256]|uniref:sugar transferase n=1 Tax=Sphingomonas sp. GCM10030256 TaxID=3273427 RepID=UPI003609EA29